MFLHVNFGIFFAHDLTNSPFKETCYKTILNLNSSSFLWGEGVVVNDAASSLKSFVYYHHCNSSKQN